MYSKNIVVGIGYASRLVCDRRLAYCPNGSAGVNFTRDGSVILRSYETNVCQIDAAGWLTCTGTYSATTRKHIGAFLREYGRRATYQDAKKAAEMGHAFNIYSGEVLPLAEYLRRAE